MLIVGVSSATKVIQTIGYKRWKLIHYLSYIAFFIAFVHSINLGTDLKKNLAPYFSPIFLGVFLLILSLLVVRIIKTYFTFEKQSHITIYSIIIIVLVVLLVTLGTLVVSQHQEINSLKDKTSILESQITVQEQIITTTASDITVLMSKNTTTNATGGATK
jgi:predicted PurR-regulated permease PerM